MNRKELLDKLSIVKPALAGNDLIPVLTCFWFLGNRVMAYNDRISISVACKTDFTGALHGDTLLGILRNSRAKDVEFKQNGDEITLQAASAKLKLGIHSVESIFDMPKPSGKSVSVDMKEFLAGVSGCLRTVGDDTSSADSLGVTVIPDNNCLSLFSTNRTSVTYYSVKSKSPIKDRAILSPDFCKQITSYKDGTLEINDDHSLFISGDVTIFGKLLESETPLDFHNVLDQHYSPKTDMVEVPANLKWMIERSLVVTDEKKDDGKVSMSVSEERMKLTSKSGKGELVDSLKIPDHPDVSIRFNPKYLKLGCDFYDRMIVTVDAIVMSNKAGSSVFLIAGS